MSLILEHVSAMVKGNAAIVIVNRVGYKGMNIGLFRKMRFFVVSLVLCWKLLSSLVFFSSFFFSNSCPQNLNKPPPLCGRPSHLLNVDVFAGMI